MQMLVVGLDCRVSLCCHNPVGQLAHCPDAVQERLHVGLGHLTRLLFFAMVLERGLMCGHLPGHLDHGGMLGADGWWHGEVMCLVLLLQLVHGRLQSVCGCMQSFDVIKMTAVRGTIVIQGIVHGMVGQDGSRLNQGSRSSRRGVLRIKSRGVHVFVPWWEKSKPPKKCCSRARRMEAVDPYPTTYIVIPWSEDAHNPYQYRAWTEVVGQAA